MFPDGKRARLLVAVMAAAVAWLAPFATASANLGVQQTDVFDNQNNQNTTPKAQYLRVTYLKTVRSDTGQPLPPAGLNKPSAAVENTAQFPDRCGQPQFTLHAPIVVNRPDGTQDELTVLDIDFKSKCIQGATFDGARKTKRGQRVSVSVFVQEPRGVIAGFRPTGFSNLPPPPPNPNLFLVVGGISRDLGAEVAFADAPSPGPDFGLTRLIAGTAAGAVAMGAAAWYARRRQRPQ